MQSESMSVVEAKKEWRLREHRGGWQMVHRDSLEAWDAADDRTASEFLRMDGNAWMCHGADFVNVQESDVAFGETWADAQAGYQWLRTLRGLQRTAAGWSTAMESLSGAGITPDYRLIDSHNHAMGELTEHLNKRPRNVPASVVDLASKQHEVGT